MKQLSIIIPIYNMEKYLSKCLSSLIVENENLQNTLEIIAVILDLLLNVILSKEADKSL